MGVQSWPTATAISDLLGLVSPISGETVFEANDDRIDTTDNIIIVDTVEQLVYALRCGTTGVTVKLRGRKNDVNTGIFQFQNDPNYKWGFDDALILAQGISLTIEPFDGIEQAIIQGLQTTTGILYSQATSGGITFNRIYFKDCVCTKTLSSRPIMFSLQPAVRMTFNNCKISIHCRVGEYGTEFDNGNIYWNNCSRYIEYSDLDDTTAPVVNGVIFGGKTEGCSTIVRNMAIALSVGIGWYAPILIDQSKNSSWDIQLYRLYIMGTIAGASDNTFAKLRAICIRNSMNCFFSVRYHELVAEDSEHLSILSYLLNYSNTNIGNPTSYTDTGITGVNVYNYSDADKQSQTAEYKPVYPIPCTRVKCLSDAQCRDYHELNKWGFFVNNQPETQEDDS